MRIISHPAWPDGYLHWDELRHWPAPEGWTHEEWWWSLKLARRTGRQDVAGLCSKRGDPFHFTRPPGMEAVLHDLDLHAGGSIGADGILPTTPGHRDHYLIRSLMEEAITSSQLEGAVATREVAKEMILTNRTPRDISERMILNNYLTMRKIQEFKDQPLSPGLLFEIHRMTTDLTLEDPGAAGRLRKDGEECHVMDEYGQVMHTPPPAAELPGRLQAMCDFANADPGGHPFVHPIVRSIILHFWLAYDHPFVDGNGRTARALFYWSALRHKYWLLEYVSISQVIKRAPAKYGYAYLHTETDDNDLTYFILYHLNVIKRAMIELTTYIDIQARRMREAEARLRGMSLLNHRQQELIRHALRHPGMRYAIEAHRRSHGVSPGTARTDLLNLEKQGLLLKSRRGKTYFFHAAPDLEEKLRILG